ncbi:MAG: PQQ-dependent sugar dehydrogenase [Candidatus Omnitrophica bacterium]|nr:PQQ-dependent sugar dehydrogenase [Candidatus Omnitrophota bacterium]
MKFLSRQFSLGHGFVFLVVIWAGESVSQSALETFDTNDPRVVIELIAEDIPIPTALAFSPDGRLFFLERETGNVRVFDNDWNLLEDPVMTVPIAYHRHEAGAMGLAIAGMPAGTETVFYVSHVTAEHIWSISRFLEDGEGHGHNLERVMDFTDCLVAPREESRWHNIDSIHFGPNIASTSPEELLYISFGDGGGIKAIGEEGIGDTAQTPDTWCGGLFWMDPNHPPDPATAQSHNICVGLRNSYDFCFDSDGTVYMTENGFNAHDEINRIEAGGNYGWPVVVGKPTDPRFVDPILDMLWVTAPTGILFYRGDRLPSQYRNRLLFCEWGQGEIRVLEGVGAAAGEFQPVGDYYLLGDPDVFTTKPIKNMGFIDMTEGPDGSIYLSAAPGAGPGVKGAILRIDRKPEVREPFVGIRAR